MLTGIWKGLLYSQAVVVAVVLAGVVTFVQTGSEDYAWVAAIVTGLLTSYGLYRLDKSD